MRLGSEASRGGVGHSVGGHGKSHSIGEAEVKVEAKERGEGCQGRGEWKALSNKLLKNYSFGEEARQGGQSRDGQKYQREYHGYKRSFGGGGGQCVDGSRGGEL